MIQKISIRRSKPMLVSKKFYAAFLALILITAYVEKAKSIRSRIYNLGIDDEYLVLKKRSDIETIKEQIGTFTSGRGSTIKKFDLSRNSYICPYDLDTIDDYLSGPTFPNVETIDFHECGLTCMGYESSLRHLLEKPNLKFFNIASNPIAIGSIFADHIRSWMENGSAELMINKLIMEPSHLVDTLAEGPYKERHRLFYQQNPLAISRYRNENDAYWYPYHSIPKRKKYKSKGIQVNLNIEDDDSSDYIYSSGSSTDSD